MSSFSVKTRVRLNDTGKIGAALFIICPIVGAFVYSLYIGAVASNLRSNLSYQQQALEPYMFMLVVTCALTLFGFVLLLIGREYSHDVKVETGSPVRQASPKPSSPYEANEARPK